MAAPPAPDWRSLQEETLRHFQALVRMDTTDPPGHEAPAVEYLKKVLEAEGIPVRTFAKTPRRPNLVARIKGNGTKRPLLIMAHTDTVNVVAEKWSHPYMVREHWAEIDAEFCIAEGGRTLRTGGKMSRTLVATTEKTPMAIRLISKGTAGHGSVPLPDNAIARLGAAIAKVAAYQTPMRLNDTTRTYFERLAVISEPAAAARYNNLVDPEKGPAIQEYLRLNEPMHYSMLRTSLSATMLKGGSRKNVIPGEAEALFDVRMAPGEDLPWLQRELEKTVGDANVRVVVDPSTRPAAPPSRLESPVFRAIEDAQKRVYPGAPVLPIMSTGASDKVYLQNKGVQCYGIGPLMDEEDAGKGFGAHSDQERILEAEVYRFVVFNWDIVTAVAAAR
ncbi:MAG: peptidase dimerization domain-containing protein [Bryobacterales bacterium]|nr:peptidase dimerization domain-containing protein [Bryobacterales bacterium]